MTASRVFPAVIVLAALMAGCGTTGPDKGAGHKAGKGGASVALPAAGSGRGGYYKDDGPGRDIPPGLELVPDAVVKAEPYYKWTSRPYSVFGQTYTPVMNEEPFVQRGIASWYGAKFHGQRTASGERYDMYKMTAAHPTLPIPSYARITSIASGKSVVVRINDRGPFHSNRIVDVSYTAALKLGLLGRGSHEVRLERLFANGAMRSASVPATPPAQPAKQAPAEIAVLMLEDRVQSDSAAVAETLPAAPAPGGSFYLQFGAYSHADKARDKAEEMGRELVKAGVAIGQLEVAPSGSVHRLYGGPFSSRAQAQEAARALPSQLGLKPIIVKR